MSYEKLCQTFLRAAAEKVRTAGLARGHRKDAWGKVCMLGAMDYCEVSILYEERLRIEKHVASVLPQPLRTDFDKYNQQHPHDGASLIAWWSNMKAKDAAEVAEKLELAAETC